MTAYNVEPTFFTNYQVTPEFFGKWQTLHTWNEKFLPIYTWEDVLYVGCTSIPEIPLEIEGYKTIFLLCPEYILSAQWSYANPIQEKISEKIEEAPGFDSLPSLESVKSKPTDEIGFDSLELGDAEIKSDLTGTHSDVKLETVEENLAPPEGLVFEESKAPVLSPLQVLSPLESQVAETKKTSEPLEEKKPAVAAPAPTPAPTPVTAKPKMPEPHLSGKKPPVFPMAHPEVKAQPAQVIEIAQAKPKTLPMEPQQIHEQMSHHFKKSMVFSFNGKEFVPQSWSDSFQQPASMITYSSEPKNCFRLIVKTLKPYHGQPAPSEAFDKFLEEWNGQDIPDHLTLVPIVVGETVHGAILGLGETSADNKNSLATAEKLSKELAQLAQASSKAA